MTRRHRTIACLVLLAALVPLVALAGARERLDTFTRGLKGLDGQFSQEVFDKNGERKESSIGRVALSAPRQFRWEYQQPFPQTIIADGKQVWVYDPDLKQATVRAQGPEEANSPLAALIDPARLERDFVVRDAGASGGLEWLEIRPRAKGAGFERARLGFDAKGLARMTIHDAIGQRTEIRFTGLKRNPAFPAGTFRFTPPKGVDVVGAR